MMNGHISSLRFATAGKITNGRMLLRARNQKDKMMKVREQHEWRRSPGLNVCISIETIRNVDGGAQEVQQIAGLHHLLSCSTSVPAISARVAVCQSGERHCTGPMSFCMVSNISGILSAVRRTADKCLLD